MPYGSGDITGEVSICIAYDIEGVVVDTPEDLQKQELKNSDEDDSFNEPVRHIEIVLNSRQERLRKILEGTDYYYELVKKGRIGIITAVGEYSRLNETGDLMHIDAGTLLPVRIGRVFRGMDGENEPFKEFYNDFQRELENTRRKFVEFLRSIGLEVDENKIYIRGVVTP